MKLSTWAKQQGISYRTAWKWFKQGKLPVAATQLPSGTILVQVEEQVAGKVAIYARVSSNDQKADLDRQVARLLEWATAQGLAVSQVIQEIGSGLNGKRRGLMRLLADHSVTTIIVEHRDPPGAVRIRVHSVCDSGARAARSRGGSRGNDRRHRA